MGKPKQAEKTEVLGIDDIAELLFVTDRTIRNWLTEKEMPSTSDGRGRRFVWAEVLPWYVKMKADEDGNARKRDPEFEPSDFQKRKDLLEKALYRRAIAEADLKELDLAERRRQVVAVEDVGRVMQDTAKNLQVEILAWPTLMVGRIFGVRDRGQLLAVLTSSARELCTRLAAVGTEPGAPSDA